MPQKADVTLVVSDWFPASLCAVRLPDVRTGGVRQLAQILQHVPLELLDVRLRVVVVHVLERRDLYPARAWHTPIWKRPCSDTRSWHPRASCLAVSPGTDVWAEHKHKQHLITDPSATNPRLRHSPCRLQWLPNAAHPQRSSGKTRREPLKLQGERPSTLFRSGAPVPGRVVRAIHVVRQYPNQECCTHGAPCTLPVSGRVVLVVGVVRQLLRDGLVHQHRRLGRPAARHVVLRVPAACRTTLRGQSLSAVQQRATLCFVYPPPVTQRCRVRAVSAVQQRATLCFVYPPPAAAVLSGVWGAWGPARPAARPVLLQPAACRYWVGSAG